MAEIEEFKVKISADTSSFDKNIENSQNKVNELNKSVKKINEVKINTDFSSLTNNKELNNVRTEVSKVRDIITDTINSSVGSVNKFFNTSSSSAGLNKVTKEYLHQLDILIVGVEAKLNTLSDKIQNAVSKFGWNSKEAITLGDDSDKLANYLKLLQQYRNGIAQGIVEVDVGNVEAIPKALSESAASVESLQDILTKSNEITTSFNKLNSLFRDLININSQTDLFGMQKENVAAFTKQINDLINKLRELGITEKEFYSKIAFNKQTIGKLGFNFAPTSPTPTPTPEPQPREQPKGNDSGIKISTILKGLVGIRSIYALVRRIVTQNQVFTSAVTNLISTLANLLKTPLDVLASILNHIAQMIAKIYNYVAGIFGWNKIEAKTTQTINKTIAGFDEITTLSGGNEETKIPTLAETRKNLGEMAKVLDVLGPILLIIEAVKWLDSVLTNSKILEFFAKLGDGITKLVASPGFKIFSGIALIISGLVIAVQNFVKMWTEGFSWINEVLMALGVALGVVGAIILGAPAAVAAAVGAVVAAVATAAVLIKEHWTEIKAFFIDLWTQIKDTAIQIWETITSRIKEMWENTKTYFAQRWEATKEMLTAIKEFFINLWTTIKDTAISIWNQLTEIVVQIWASLTSRITEMCNSFLLYMQQRWEATKVFFGGIKTSFFEIIDAIKKKFEEVKTWFKQKIGPFFTSSYWVNKWQTIKTTTAEWVKNIINAIIDKINQGINKINESGFIKALNGIAQKIDEDWGIELKSIPRLANGGVITAPTVAMIGEYSGANTNPEIVAPQALLTEIINKSDERVASAIVTMGNAIINSINDKDTATYLDSTQLARGLYTAMNKETKRRGTSLVGGV